MTQRDASEGERSHSLGVSGFWSPGNAAARLARAPLHWCVVGGWAIDLWLGYDSRPHADLEISVPRESYGALAAWLHELEPYAIGHGKMYALTTETPFPSDRHQLRFIDAKEKAWRLDVMLDPGDSETWIYRRDEQLRVPRSRLVAWRGFIPYLRPEAVLLFKAKATREKDERDFETCLPRLDGAATEWLATSLDRLHPGHPWIARLQAGPPQSD